MEFLKMIVITFIAGFVVSGVALVVIGRFDETSGQNYQKVITMCKQDSLTLQEFKNYFQDKQITRWEFNRIQQHNGYRLAKTFYETIK